MALLLGVPATLEELRSNLQVALTKKQDIIKENWLIHYDPIFESYWIVWGDYMDY